MMKELKIDPEFRSLLYPLSTEEYSQLKENILRDGCLEPLIVWGDILVDGHNRYQICIENGISFDTKEINFKDRFEAVCWIIKNQFGRRNLTAFQRSELALKLKPMIAERAKVNQREAGGAVKDKLPKAEKTETREELGKIAGVSGKTIDRAETILTKGSEKDIQEVRDGKVSISKKAKEIKGREGGKETSLPKKESGGIKRDISPETVNRTLVENLYSVWKTLEGTKELCYGNLSKQDERELTALLNKINQFIERKGGVHYEES